MSPDAYPKPCSVALPGRCFRRNATDELRRYVTKARTWARVGAIACLLFTSPLARAQSRVSTTLEDFFQPGSQPNGAVTYDPFRASSNCRNCHAMDPKSKAELPVYGAWQGSMMGQAARDPLFYACLTIANQDAAFAGDLCIRCHTPAGWLAGRSEPTDGSALIAADRDGVSCSVCHRMVDPVFKAGVSPPIDAQILANINPKPVRAGSGNFIMDPNDVRRGPYADPMNPQHPWLASAFHRSAELCATCHDVSNPAYRRQDDGTYTLDLLNARHPTADKYDMFPLERTFSEWLHSDFARGGVDMGGRFGGTRRVVSTCQHCHMPTVTARGCYLAKERSDLAAHEFVGGNAWVQDMILNLYPHDGLNADYLNAGKERAVSMLQRAARLELLRQGNYLSVRIINETGHKLPTGYPEGRRMWINVQFFDESMQRIGEFGAYDPASAELSTSDTKVYQVKLGMDAAVAEMAGLVEGESSHFALNNVVLKDNRIPPRGFANDAYERVQAAPTGAAYADGKFWDDTAFRLRADVRSASVSVYYQTASKEFITFLRDENRTDDRGQVLYDQWEMTGKSLPVPMAEKILVIDGSIADGDSDGNGTVDLADCRDFVACGLDPAATAVSDECRVPFDYDEDGDVDLRDVRELLLDYRP